MKLRPPGKDNNVGKSSKEQEKKSKYDMDWLSKGCPEQGYWRHDISKNSDFSNSYMCQKSEVTIGLIITERGSLFCIYLFDRNSATTIEHFWMSRQIHFI